MLDGLSIYNYKISIVWLPAKSCHRTVFGGRLLAVHAAVLAHEHRCTAVSRCHQKYESEGEVYRLATWLKLIFIIFLPPEPTLAIILT